MKRFIWNLFKGLILIVSIVNLVWFLGFDYQNPHDIFGVQYEVVEETEIDTSGLSLVVPMNSLKYNGNGVFDPLKDVYVVDEKGVLVDSAEISYSIHSPLKDNLREKIIEYEADVNGETLYGKRNLSLGIEYSGPSIFVKQMLPYCKEGEINTYLDKLKNDDYLEVLDGFGKSILDDITVALKRYDRGEELATVTISVTNVYQDSISVDYQIPMNSSGIVLLLLNNKAVVRNGSSFNVKTYVDQCYYETEVDGETTVTSLLGNVYYEGSVDTSTTGKYNITVFTRNAEGVVSIGRKLEVMVLEKDVE